MTEHHGIDIEALAGAAHSIFAPSSSAGWLVCEDYILANLNEPDNAGVDAAYGTVGHEVGEEWLLRIDALRTGVEPITEEMIADSRPAELIGTTRIVKEGDQSFPIEIDEEMLAFVAQYVLWCAELPGAHYIEQRVYFSRLTPIPEQGGTADHAACEPGVLTITDLKLGRSPRNIVSAAENKEDPRFIVGGKLNGNTQAGLYALGFFYKYDHLYNFQRIIIRIGQPTLDHFDIWETNREELLAFAEFVKVRAHANWKPLRNRTPSNKGCRWCKVRSSCAALIAWRHEDVDDVFDAVEDDVIEGEFRVVTRQEMIAVKAEIDSADDYQPPILNLDAATLTTEQMAKLLPKRKLMEDFFNGIYDELNRRASQGEEIPGFKLVNGREGNREFKGKDDPPWIEHELAFLGLEPDDVYERKLGSPARAEAKLRAKYGLSAKAATALLSHLVYRNRGRQTLVPRTDKREELEDVGSVFDDVSDGGL